MEDEEAIRAEISHLRTLAMLNTDVKFRAEIQLMILELQRKLRESGNGQSTGA